MKMSAEDALARLMEGNRRFVTGTGDSQRILGAARRCELLDGQEPFAVVLGCADSRVPPELVFDQGLGDLFVVRVAGNLAGPSQTESLEFAAQRLGVRLIMVLGHKRCGAVRAALDELRGPQGPSGALPTILGRIRPVVEGLIQTGGEPPSAALLRRAVQANVRATVDHLRRDSEPLRRLSGEGLLIVGAEYACESGEVSLLDNPARV
jgi:carbonic anhydrase